MNQRIKGIADRVVRGEMFPPVVTVEYDRCDLFLPESRMYGKRAREYIEAQGFMLFDECCFSGLFRFDGSFPGDIFGRPGHKHFWEVYSNFYNKPINNLLTFEWQHTVGDFEKIIKRGIRGVLADIEKSESAHEGDGEALDFLASQRDICAALINRARKGAALAKERAGQCENPEYRENMLALSEGLSRVPEHPARSFYEAMLSLFFCYPMIPDSIGLIDRYLRPYYEADIASGLLSRERAGEYLQELFLMLQARINPKSDRFYRGGESHFCIGGYLPSGEDGFSDLSRLIVESLMALPTWIPQISLRWTEKTPREVLRFMLDCERHDPNKRIAFVNDEPRLKGLMKYNGLSFEEAVSYTMMGCNELALPGGIVFGFDPMNILRSVESTFHKRRSDVNAVADFDALYKIYEEELFADLSEADRLGCGLQNIRSRDMHVVSNIFIEGCIERAKPVTQGGVSRYIAVGLPIGLSNVIDSLSVVKQFVFDEKTVSMSDLTDALAKNWAGYESLRAEIMKRGKFFGNDDETSNSVANRLFGSLDKWNTGENYLGKKWVFGNLIGYNEHNKFFGEKTLATPDGRYSGDSMNFGIGQTSERDREGVTSLLLSVAKCDPYCILTGPSVTNVMLEESLVRNDDSFDKLTSLFESYFRMGGTHFQLTYVSREQLIEAKQNPDMHRNLRVRVSGFSDYFRYLNSNLQDEIIERTSHDR